MITTHHHFHPDPAHPLHSSPDHLYLDIETTGLSRQNSILYMIGCGFLEEKSLHTIQWFNEDGRSEKEMLSALSRLLSEKEWTLITFNGDRFDLPYLRARWASIAGEQASFGASDTLPGPDAFGVSDTLPGPESFGGPDSLPISDLLPGPDPLDSLPSVDLYRLLRPFQHVFGLERGRQKDWESCLGIGREDAMTGRELIGVYRSYLKTRDESLLRLLFLHNYEDVCHLPQLAGLMALQNLLSGDFTLTDINVSTDIDTSTDIDVSADIAASDQKEIIISCRSDHFLPAEVTMETPEGKIHMKGSTITLIFPAVPRVMKHFFQNPADYYYLPREDRAIHKSVAIYVDKAYREKCRPHNCYAHKKGVFLPVYRKDCMKEFTLYSPEYRSPTQYIDFAEFSKADKEIQHLWVLGFLTHHLL